MNNYLYSDADIKIRAISGKNKFDTKKRNGYRLDISSLSPPLHKVELLSINKSKRGLVRVDGVSPASKHPILIPELCRIGSVLFYNESVETGDLLRADVLEKAQNRFNENFDTKEREGSYYYKKVKTENLIKNKACIAFLRGLNFICSITYQWVFSENIEEKSILFTIIKNLGVQDTPLMQMLRAGSYKQKSLSKKLLTEYARKRMYILEDFSLKDNTAKIALVNHSARHEKQGRSSTAAEIKPDNELTIGDMIVANTATDNLKEDDPKNNQPAFNTKELDKTGRQDTTNTNTETTANTSADTSINTQWLNKESAREQNKKDVSTSLVVAEEQNELGVVATTQAHFDEKSPKRFSQKGLGVISTSEVTQETTERQQDEKPSQPKRKWGGGIGIKSQ